MRIRKRKLFRLAIDISDKFNIWIQDLFGINAKRKVLEKKQDFVTLKELDNTIGKALGITGKPIEKQTGKDISGKAPEVIEKPKLKEKRDKSDKNEYQISDKDLNDFISFAKKAKLIIDSKNSQKLIKIDFQELHYSDFEISLDVSIENTYSFDGEVHIYDKDTKISSFDSVLAYQTFKAAFNFSVPYQIDENNIQLFINLFIKPKAKETFFKYYEDVIFQQLEFEQAEGEDWAIPYDEKYYFKKDDRLIDDIGFSDFEAFEEFDGDYSLEVPIDFEEELEGIDSIKINGNVLSYKFNDMQDYKHLAILLMASYQKNIAAQVHKKLIGIK